MQTKIVVGYDGSEEARDALTLAEHLAEATGARLTLANVYPGRPRYNAGKAAVGAFFDILARDAMDALRDAAGDLDCDVEAIPAPSPARGLQDVAEDTRASMIVVGSAQRGKLGRIEAGHTAEHLLHGAPCAVVVAPRGYAGQDAPRYGRITVGFDGSPEASVALHAAIAMARTTHAVLRVVTVADPVWRGTPLYAPPLDIISSIREEARGRMAAAVAAIPDDITVEKSLFEGDVAEVLAAQPDCDLVVLGSRGYGRVKGVLLGSVSSKVVRGGPAPVMVVPRGVEAIDNGGLSARAASLAG